MLAMTRVTAELLLPAKLFHGCATMDFMAVDYGFLWATIAGVALTFAVAGGSAMLLSRRPTLATFALFGMFASRGNASGVGVSLVAALYPALLPILYMTGLWAVPPIALPVPHEPAARSGASIADNRTVGAAAD